MSSRSLVAIVALGAATLTLGVAHAVAQPDRSPAPARSADTYQVEVLSSSSWLLVNTGTGDVQHWIAETPTSRYIVTTLRPNKVDGWRRQILAPPDSGRR